MPHTACSLRGVGEDDEQHEEERANEEGLAALVHLRDVVLSLVSLVTRERWDGVGRL